MARLSYRNVTTEESEGVMGLLRSVVGSSRTFAPWVRALRGKSGAYVIRDRDSKRVWYVGESHTGALYETLTRHFQRWKSNTNKVFDRRDVEVAVRVVSPSKAISVQNALICSLGPAENEVRRGCQDHVPF